jgi:hypothetical protein
MSMTISHFAAQSGLRCTARGPGVARPCPERFAACQLAHHTIFDREWRRDEWNSEAIAQHIGHA